MANDIQLVPEQVKPDTTSDSNVFDGGAKMQLKPMGASGTELFAGYFTEEYLQSLRGRKGAKVFDEMRRSEAQISMLLNAIMNPIKAATWEFEEADPALVPDSEKHEELIEYCAKEMIDWEAHLHEALTCLIFGYSIFEIINNVVFNHPTFGTFNGLKGLAFRSQKTIERWNVARDTGDLEWVEQWIQGDLALQRSSIVKMAAEFLLIFTLQKEGDNYEGIPVLRPMYGPWFRKNLYQKLAGIGLEKNAIGTPMGTIPAGKQTEEQINNFKELLSNFTAHECAYLMKPEGWTVEILKSDFDAEKVKEMILLENTEMINAVVANFLALGTNGGGGAFALGSDLSDFFLSGIQIYANIIAGVWNRKLIPTLVKLNFGPQAAYPKLKVSGINDKAGKELADILSTFVDKKVLSPDMKLEEFVRKSYKLPAADPLTTREVAPAPAPGAMQFAEPEIELGGPGSGPQPGGGAAGPTDPKARLDAAKAKMETAKKEAKRARSRADTAPDRAEANPKSLQQANEKIRAYNAAAEEYNAALDAFIDSKSVKPKLSEPRIKLAEGWKTQWKTDKADVKATMQEGLTGLLEDYTLQIRRGYKAATPATKGSVALNLTPKTAEYTKALREQLAEVANRALIGARKETPKAKDVQLSERIQLAAPKGGFYDALPANIRRLVKNQTDLIVATQAADLEKIVAFQYASSQASTESIEQIILDIEGAATPVIEGSTSKGTSIDAAAGDAVSQTSNQARLEWFFEPEVLDTIESFTFTNEDPVSEICQELDGTTWAVNDPDLDRYAPPLHHNCKSRLVPNEKGADGNPVIDRGGTAVSQKGLDAITLCECNYHLGASFGGVL